MCHLGQNGDSGPLFDGDTTSPQQCLVFTTYLSLWPGDFGPLFNGGRNSSKKLRAQIKPSAPHCEAAPPNPSSVFPLFSVSLGFWYKTCQGPPHPIEPPAVFFTPLSASLEQNMSGPAQPAVIFHSLFCGLGPPTPWQAEAYSKGLWPCAPPSPAWVSLTFL